VSYITSVHGLRDEGLYMIKVFREMNLIKSTLYVLSEVELSLN